jgi:tetratricopeptide (TPR) repeat protein
LDEAERLLLEANQKAKSKDLNLRVASIDLTLSALYLSKQQYDLAEKFVKEGFAYSQLAKSKRYESDFKYTSYQLEFKRKNYEKALNYLQQIYRQDSLNFYNNVSAQLGILQAKYKQEEIQREAEYRQKLDRFLFWASTIVVGLLLVVIVLLVGNVKRKARTNQRLTELNAEVSRQKDNVDRINHHLEEIIDERTKDLQIKNKKLSEYSSYLSHQIRGPIATLKGLINLEKEGLVNKEECFNMMDKCVSEIDDKIIDMSDMLHDPERTSLSGS